MPDTDLDRHQAYEDVREKNRDFEDVSEEEPYLEGVEGEESETSVESEFDLDFDPLLAPSYSPRNYRYLSEYSPRYRYLQQHVEPGKRKKSENETKKASREDKEESEEKYEREIGEEEQGDEDERELEGGYDREYDREYGGEEDEEEQDAENEEEEVKGMQELVVVSIPFHFLFYSHFLLFWESSNREGVLVRSHRVRTLIQVARKNVRSLWIMVLVVGQPPCLLSWAPRNIYLR